MFLQHHGPCRTEFDPHAHRPLLRENDAFKNIAATVLLHNTVETKSCSFKFLYLKVKYLQVLS